MPTSFRSVLILLLVLGGCGCASLGSAATTGEFIEVPFDFYRDSIIVQAKIVNQGPFNMLLDTGVDPSVIDLATAKEIGLKLADTGQPGSGGGTEINLSYQTELPLVELGPLTAGHVNALAVGLTETSAALGKPVYGVLGYSLLKDRIVQINFPKRRVRFYTKTPYPKATLGTNSAKRSTVPFSYRDDVLVEGVMVNGSRMVANLDTGSNGSFQLTPAAVSALGLEAQVNKAEVSHSTGFNGLTVNREGKIDNVTIGGISVDAPNVVFYGNGTGRDNVAWGVRIGNAFLKDFVVTVDYQEGALTLERP